MKKLFYLFAMVAAVFAASCSSAPATPGDAALHIYDLMAEGQYEAVANEFYFGDKSAEDIEKGKGLIVSLLTEKGAPQMEAKGGIAATEVTEEIIAEDGQSAKVTLKITYGNGEVDDNNKLEFVKDSEGNWKVPFKK